VRRLPSGENFLSAPRSYIQPRISGDVSSYFEWSVATQWRPESQYGAMHRAGSDLLSSMHYGFSRENLYLRVDLREDLLVSGELPEYLTVDLLFPVKDRKVAIRIDPNARECLLHASPLGLPSDRIPDTFEPSGEIPTGTGVCVRTLGGVDSGVEAAFRTILELGIPFRFLGCEAEERIEFFLVLRAGGTIGERWPRFGSFSAELPGGDFEERMWEV
jgi:hypothetical protein